VTVLTARVTARPSERRELAQALLTWAAAARREAGAVMSNVYEDVEAPAVFGLVAEWKSREDLEAHLRSEGFSVLMGALELLGDPSRLAITRMDDDSADDTLRTIRKQRETKS